MVRGSISSQLLPSICAALIVFLLSCTTILLVAAETTNIVLEPPSPNQYYTFNASTHYIVPPSSAYNFQGCVVTIEPGVVITMGKGSNLLFSRTTVNAVGTAENPIIFTSETPSEADRFGCLNFDGQNTAMYVVHVTLRHVHIINGGYACTVAPITFMQLHSLTMDHVLVANSTATGPKIDIVADVSIIDSIFERTGALTVGSRSVGGNGKNFMIARNKFSPLDTVGAINMIPYTEFSSIYIGDNIVEGGTTFFTYKTSGTGNNITIANNVLKKATGLLNFDASLSTINVRNNDYLTVNMKNNRIFNPSGTVITIQVSVSASSSYFLKGLLNLERNLIKDYTSKELVSVTVSLPSQIATSNLDILYNYNTMIRDSSSNVIGNVMKVSDQSSMNIPVNEMINARYNYYGTNNFTEIASRIQGLRVDEFVPFSTESSSDEPCPSIEPNCDLRDIVCPADYRIIQMSNLCSTCQCSGCPFLNCSNGDLVCGDGFALYAKYTLANECGQCACRKICSTPIITSCESHSCQSGYKAVFKPATNESECNTCECSVCPQLNCSNGDLVCPEGFEPFEKYDPAYECNQCACRKTCPTVTSCESHSCPIGYESSLKLAVNESECNTCQCSLCPQLNCSDEGLVCGEGFEVYVRSDSENECGQCACRKICPTPIITSCESHSCQSGYKTVFKPAANDSECNTCECEEVICESGFTGVNCNVQFSLQSNLATSSEVLFNRRRSLQATAKITPVEKQGSVVIEWSLFTSQHPEQNLIGSRLSSGVTSNMRTISLRSESLAPGTEYTLRLSVGDKIKKQFCEQRFKTGSAPSNGVFTVTPKKGTVLIDTFRLEATNWITSEQNDAILQYSFGYIHPSTGSRVFLRSFTSSGILESKLPITGTNSSVYVQVKSPSGDYTELIDSSITVELASSNNNNNNVAETITDMSNKLSEVNKTELETQLNVIVSAVDTFGNELKKNETSKLIESLIDTIDQNKKDISSINQVQTIKTLTRNNSGLNLSSNTTIKAAQIIEQVLSGLNGTDANSEILSSALEAAKNLADTMISNNSTSSERSAFVDLLNQLTSKLREEILEGESKELSLKELEARIARLSSYDNNSGNHTISIPVPNNSNSTGAATVELQIENVPVDQPSVYVQGEIYTNPENEYVNSCSSQLVSPTVNVKWFDEDQQPIVVVTTDQRRRRVNGDPVPLFQSSLPITVSNQQQRRSLMSVTSTNTNSSSSASYEYVCKYFDEERRVWTNDTSVCETVVTLSDISTPDQVTCRCYKTVTHGVSLDYVQVGSEDTEEGQQDGEEFVCTNPCGCSLPNKKKNRASLPNWGIALIVLACVTVVIIAALVLIAIALILVQMYRAPKSDVEQVTIGSNGLVSYISSISLSNFLCFKPTREKKTENIQHSGGLDRWW